MAQNNSGGSSHGKNRVLTKENLRIFTKRTIIKKRGVYPTRKIIFEKSTKEFYDCQSDV